MFTIYSFSSGKGYLAYVEKESVGKWVGTGSRILGLDGEVEKQDFHSLRKGLDPSTGEKLRIREVSDRVYHKPWGTEIYRARELYDLVISAPKTVSIMGVIDPRISEAHTYAVDRTWREMEQRCGAMVIASFHHQYSRTLDPQEHTHLVAPNLSFDGDRWKTLGANNLYRSQEQITEHYREHLLGALETYGYRINYPGIDGVPTELVEKFSQRSQVREKAIALYQEKNGVEPTNREVALMVRTQRDAKEYLPVEEIRERQLQRLSPVEREKLIVVRDQALERYVPRERVEYETWRPHPYNMEPQKERAERAERIRIPAIRDQVASEPGYHHKPWSYGSKQKQRTGV
jgi:conjugative relaxase-like TrwC/TraI family protein